jgi:hypothetical protein
MWRLLTALVLLTGAGAQADTYYVDSGTGDDARPGTAPGRAWRSLEKANGVPHARRAAAEPLRRAAPRAEHRLAGGPQRHRRGQLPLLARAVEDTLVEENYVYVGAGLDVQLLLLSDWQGWGGARNIRLEGNEELAQGVDVADWTGRSSTPRTPRVSPSSS